MGAGRDLDGPFEEAGRSDKVDLGGWGGCTVGTPGRMKKQDVELPEELGTERKEGGKRKESLMWTEVGLGRRARGPTTSLPPN